MNESGSVAFHLSLGAGGVVRVAPGGGLEIWVPAAPGQSHHEVVSYSDGAWRQVLDQVVRQAEVPQYRFGDGLSRSSEFCSDNCLGT